MDVSAEYIPTMSIEIKAGRNFEPESETERKESVVITEGWARAFNLTDPIGKEMMWLVTGT